MIKDVKACSDNNMEDETRRERENRDLLLYSTRTLLNLTGKHGWSTSATPSKIDCYQYCFLDPTNTPCRMNEGNRVIKLAGKHSRQEAGATQTDACMQWQHHQQEEDSSIMV